MTESEEPLLTTEKNDDEEFKNSRSEEKITEDETDSEQETSYDTSSKKAEESESDAREKLLETEKEVLDRQEEIIKELMDSEKEMETQSNWVPCYSCEFSDPIKESTTTCCFGLCTRSLSRYHGVREFWIVSAPGDETPQETYDKLCAATQSKHLSKNYKFHIPNLRIGTMDNLMETLEELQELDNDTEESIKKLISFSSVFLDNEDEVREYLLVNHMDISTYLTKFTWDVEKYPIHTPLRSIFDSLKEKIEKIAEDLNIRSHEIGNLQSTLQKIEQTRIGNLLTRSLDKLVKKEDLVLDSKYFTTLLVVVPKAEKEKWLEKYETLSEMVIPKSSANLFSDEKHSLYTVVVAKKFVDEFEAAALENKFMVRDFEFSEHRTSEEDEFFEKMKKIQSALLDVSFRWWKVKFSECFVAWIHIKALRVFSESVLRYGLPRNFQAALLIPIKSKKLKLVLNDLYKNLECDLAHGLMPDIPGELTLYGVTKYLPYVFLTVTTDFKNLKGGD